MYSVGRKIWLRYRRDKSGREGKPMQTKPDLARLLAFQRLVTRKNWAVYLFRIDFGWSPRTYFFVHCQGTGWLYWAVYLYWFVLGFSKCRMNFWSIKQRQIKYQLQTKAYLTSLLAFYGLVTLNSLPLLNMLYLEPQDRLFIQKTATNRKPMHAKPELTSLLVKLSSL